MLPSTQCQQVAASVGAGSTDWRQGQGGPLHHERPSLRPVSMKCAPKSQSAISPNCSHVQLVQPDQDGHGTWYGSHSQAQVHDLAKRQRDQLYGFLAIRPGKSSVIRVDQPIRLSSLS